ncbi:MAG: hypothetical protein ACRELT_08455, partial [Longimicrobiales bacterium]
MIEVVVLIGWGAQFLHWLLALAAARDGAAHRTEWTRELIVRAAMLLGIGVAVTTGAVGRVVLPPLVTFAAAALFLLGHMVAIAGRATLAGA